MSNAIFFGIFAIGNLFLSTLFVVDNKLATKIIFAMTGFLFAITTASILGHYFVLNDYSFEMSYFEARIKDPEKFQDYLWFLKVGMLLAFVFAMNLRLLLAKVRNKFNERKLFP